MSEHSRWQVIISLVLLFSTGVFCQTITLDKAQELARKNYPSLKQQDIINNTAGLNISNLNKNYLPQLSINGQASYQSDVTKVDVSLPGVKFDSPSKDQYKLIADINQVIYDGGATRQQKTLSSLNAAVESQQVEVELYNLKERVNDIFLGILYTDQLIKQNDLIQKDINTGLKRISAQVQNGVAFRSSANILKAELLKAGQRLIELQANRRALIETLSIFTDQKLSEQAVFEKPAVTSTTINDITRPEIKLFASQQTLFAHQNKLITAKNLPKTSVFVQGGYGRPGLNMLKNDFEPFYITGIKLNWALGGLYTKKNDREIVKLNQETVQSKRETFILNTNAQLATQKSEIDKLNKLVQSDNEIIDLRKEVTTAAKAQLENGVMTASDYLVEVNAEDQARQSLIAHELQLLQAQIKYNTIKGE